jgi:membrane-associated phospholipid phosphatase
MIDALGGVVAGLLPATLRAVLVDVIAVVATLCLVGGGVIIRPSRCRTLVAELRPRLREAAPYLAGLAGVLLANSLLRDRAQRLSFQIGINIGSVIEGIEGGFVATLQSLATPLATTYFSYIYIYGYVFLLVFPLLAYLALSDRVPFRRLVTAYGLNYVIGVLCYILFVAYGPRNVGVAEPLLYDTFPQFQFLTSEVNSPTNVFPSLHTSLSTTVAIFATKTRETYPLWTAIALGLAASVIISTMYLGIHWATDVVAGALLGWGCVTLAERYIE